MVFKISLGAWRMFFAYKNMFCPSHMFFSQNKSDNYWELVLFKLLSTIVCLGDNGRRPTVFPSKYNS